MLLEFRLCGNDVDDAGGGVLAEQRALRTLEHFDVVDFAKVAVGCADARPIDAVDHHTDRGLQARVVTRGTHVP